MQKRICNIVLLQYYETFKVYVSFAIFMVLVFLRYYPFIIDLNY